MNSRSNSARDIQNENSDNNDDSNETTEKAKHSKSLFFDPTVKVNHVFPDLIWKMAFHRLPKAPELHPATLTTPQIMDLLHCCLLSRAVYKKTKRHLPPNLSNIVFEANESDFYKIPFFVVDSNELNTIFIAYRGSDCLKDWHVDFMASAIEFDRGHVHEGVYFTSLNLFDTYKDQIRQIALSHPGREIVMTGHSLGGAVAAMMAVLFNEEMIDLKVHAVCFAPVASFSKEVWDFTHKYIQTYINYGDLVPFISYYNTYHLPENSLPKIPREQLVNWCIRKINKHSKRPEFRLLVDRYTHPVLEPFKLVPPGVSYLIRITDKKAATVELQTIEDNQVYFGQFVKNLSSLKHAMKLYKHSVIRYFCEFHNQDPELISYYQLSRKEKHLFPFHKKKTDNHNEHDVNDDSDSDTNSEHHETDEENAEQRTQTSSTVSGEYITNDSSSSEEEVGHAQSTNGSDITLSSCASSNTVTSSENGSEEVDYNLSQSVEPSPITPK